MSTQQCFFLGFRFLPKGKRNVRRVSLLRNAEPLLLPSPTLQQISKKESGRRKNNGGIPSLPHLGSGNVHPHQQQRPSSSSSAAEAGHVGSAAEGRKSNKRRFLVVAAANAKPEAPVEEDEAMEVGGKEELEAEGEGEEMVVEEDEEAVGNM